MGDYMPDLIVFDKIIVETKTIDRIGNHERGQVINYLRISGLQVGIVLNFKHAKLEWERVAV
ncbi:GxxExxY protein [Nitrosomonas sp. ANs5]|uniref:GxxExxY protein n=1 Tax=Nitrosomonas sp. ANs5 TaxID=3423941 RepID=UPI003D336DE4